jgi:hypothetical protein
MMDSFPKMLAELDTTAVGRIALWLYETAPLQRDPVPPAEEITTQFSLFETKWSSVLETSQ